MSRFFVSILLAMSGLAASIDAHAQNARQARSEVEASMLVTGHVDIDREGRVSAHALDQQDKLPGYVIALIDRAIPAMRFEPIVSDGAPIEARAKMSLRMVATPTGDGNMDLRIRSVHFGDEYASDDAGSIRSAGMRPPRYPAGMVRIGAKGTVYLLLKIGRDGRVAEVMAEQVNLTAIGNARQMEMIRSTLSRSAIEAARAWTFVPPTEGEEARKDHWVVRVPVEYMFGDDRAPAYGQWVAYHPGPRQRPDWAQPTPEGFSPDALVAGAVAPERSRFRLLTPLEG